MYVASGTKGKTAVVIHAYDSISLGVAVREFESRGYIIDTDSAPHPKTRWDHVEHIETIRLQPPVAMAGQGTSETTVDCNTEFKNLVIVFLILCTIGFLAWLFF